MADQRSGGIAYCDETWSPAIGCSPVSDGCKSCWAKRQAARMCGPGKPYEGLVRDGEWTGKTRLVEHVLDAPLRWRRPRTILVASMGDLFHESRSECDIHAVFDVMARAQRHTFLILTKRADRMRRFCRRLSFIGPKELPHLTEPSCWLSPIGDRTAVPLPNVRLGVSVEDQPSADARISLLLQTPAASWWVSVEPMLGPVDLKPWLPRRCGCPEQYTGRDCPACHGTGRIRLVGESLLDHVVVGGESGPHARPCDVAWIRDVVRQCREARVPCLVKQLGAHPHWQHGDREVCGARLSVRGGESGDWSRSRVLRDRAGADPAEWPADLRVREIPR